jgi:hypothetical protein
MNPVDITGITSLDLVAGLTSSSHILASGRFGFAPPGFPVNQKTKC